MDRTAWIAVILCVVGLVLWEIYVTRQMQLRPADAELHLTNRGGAIKEIVLLNYSAEGGQRVVLSSANTIPVGAIVDQPTNPVLSEFTAKRNQDGSVQYEAVTPD